MAGLSSITEPTHRLYPEPLRSDPDFKKFMDYADDFKKYFLSEIKNINDTWDPKKTPVSYLREMCRTFNADINTQDTVSSLRFKLSQASRRNRYHGSVQLIIELITEITGIPPLINFAYEFFRTGWDQNDTVSTIQKKMSWDQTGTNDILAWQQTNIQNQIINVDLRGLFDSSILEQVYAIISKQKYVMTIVNVGYFDGDSAVIFKTIWSSDLDQSAPRYELRNIFYQF